MPGGHDGTVEARPDATVHFDKQPGVIENLEQVLLRDLAASSFQLQRRIEHAARVVSQPSVYTDACPREQRASPDSPWNNQ